MLGAYVGVSCFKLLVIEEMRISGLSEKFQWSRDFNSSFMETEGVQRDGSRIRV